MAKHVHIYFNDAAAAAAVKHPLTNDCGCGGNKDELSDPHVGKLVKFMTPGMNGPKKTAGTVKWKRPDGRYEVKMQMGGYIQLRPNEWTE